MITGDVKHHCPECKTEMECFGSQPWGVFNYHCEKCGYREQTD